MEHDKKNIDAKQAKKSIYDYQEGDEDYEDNEEATSILLGYVLPECPECSGKMKVNFETRMCKCFSCGYTIDEEYVEEMVFCDDDDGGIDEELDVEYTNIYRNEPDEVDGESYSGEMPFVCTTCGGPWPKCETSCKMFDDDD